MLFVTLRMKIHFYHVICMLRFFSKFLLCHTIGHSPIFIFQLPIYIYMRERESIGWILADICVSPHFAACKAWALVLFTSSVWGWTAGGYCLCWLHSKRLCRASVQTQAYIFIHIENLCYITFWEWNLWAYLSITLMALTHILHPENH